MKYYLWNINRVQDITNKRDATHTTKGNYPYCLWKLTSIRKDQIAHEMDKNKISYQHMIYKFNIY